MWPGGSATARFSDPCFRPSRMLAILWTCSSTTWASRRRSQNSRNSTTQRRWNIGPSVDHGVKDGHCLAGWKNSGGPLPARTSRVLPATLERGYGGNPRIRGDGKLFGARTGRRPSSFWQRCNIWHSSLFPCAPSRFCFPSPTAPSRPNGPQSYGSVC